MLVVEIDISIVEIPLLASINTESFESVCGFGVSWGKWVGRLGVGVITGCRERLLWLGGLRLDIFFLVSDYLG